MLKTKCIADLSLFTAIFLIYFLCTCQTINFWDSPEFIVSNFTLQASHPPGAPLYTLISSFILLFFSVENTAFASNLISALFGALTVVMVYKITLKVISSYLKDRIQTSKTIRVSGALLAALSLAFSTSFWSVAIETEVYTMSFALFTALIYIVLKLYATNDKKEEQRLLLLFSILLGFAVSVHLILTAIVIPSTLLIIHKKRKLTLKSFMIGLLGGLGAFFILYGVLLKGLIKIASSIDVYSVNNLNLPVNYGALFTLITTLIGLLTAYFILQKKQKGVLSIVSLAILLFLTGSSIYILPILRSDANTLVAEKVSTANRLQTYISGERFGVDQIPLIYGPTYNAPLDNATPFINTKPILTYDGGPKKYIEAHDGISNKINYDNQFETLFPRMYDAKNATNYKAWTTIKGKAISHNVQGETQTLMKPTFKENLGFFINYQVVWLNLRYLFWNFIGRQNDHHGLGYIKNGNWLSGINFIDKHRVGDQSLVPQYYQNNKSFDSYYFLPFLIGLLGCIGLFGRKKIAVFFFLLFLTFGIGITVFVNPLPSSILIRERDYIFIGSFIIFSIWIGLSVVTISHFFRKISDSTNLLMSVIVLLFVASPLQLLSKGWDNHQIRKDDFAYRFGKSYLDSCPENAILITNGDNMTFPLWYLQEVEGYRKDVRVINFDQLNIDTHIDNLKKKKLNAAPIKIDLDKDLYINGIEKIIPLQKESEQPVDLETLTQFLNSDNTLTNWNGRGRHYIPGDVFEFSIDTTLNYYNKAQLETYDTKVVPKLVWAYPKDFYGLHEIALFNIIKNNLGNTPICFANNGKTNHLAGLDNYLLQKGMISELIPVQRISTSKNPKLVATETSYKHLVEKTNFKAFDSKKEYVRDENKTYAQEILRQNYYFLAQALFEENKIDKAKKTIDTCINLFPNDEVLYKQYAYALGRMNYRMGFVDEGDRICTTAMENIWNEITWITSFDTPNAIINVRHVNKLLKIYQQMVSQIKPFNAAYAQQCESDLKHFTSIFNAWYINNWPY